MATAIKVDREGHAFAILDRLDQMRNDKSRSNFKVKVGTNTILAQRDILIAASNYFDATLSHDTKENQRGGVEMKNVDFECVKTCIDFVYGKKISVPSEKYEDLMIVAHMMQLKILCKGIEELMVKSINPKSFIKFKKISDLFDCLVLRQKCSEFAEENFHAICKEKDFNEIDKQYLLSLIESENIKISEFKKLEILLQWVKHDSSRQSDLINLLNAVNLDKIPIGHRRYFIENEQLISEDFECFRKFSISIMNSTRIPSLNPYQQLKNILMFDDDFQVLRVFNPQTNQVIETGLQKHVVEASYSVTMLKDRIYMLGRDKSVHSQKYSKEASTWDRKADMIDDHGEFPPAAVVSGDIYVVGGGGGGMGTSTVEKYDPNRNEWKKFCEKSKKSNGSEVVALEGCIYNLGGIMDLEVSKEVEKLDVTKQEWIPLAPMNESRIFAAATEWNGNIIIAGGCGTDYLYLKSVEHYDVVMNQWTTLPKMNIERSYFDLFSVDGQIFAFGGLGCDVRSSIEKYDEHNNDWTVVEVAEGANLNIHAAILVEAES